MSRARVVLAGLGLWCAVVAVVATLVWVVIARAGAGVVPDATPGAAATGSLPVPRPVEGAGERTSPGVELTPRSASPGTPSTAPTSTGVPTTTVPPTGPVVQRRSWSGAAGHLVSQCQGATGRLVSAYPNTGWRYQILSAGPVVRVGFRRIGEDRGLAVTGRCVAGVPQFAVSGYQPGDE